jgi:hypothetical protein
MLKYAVTTKTETIMIVGNTEENIERKIDFIKSFSEVISVEKVIAIV